MVSCDVIQSRRVVSSGITWYHVISGLVKWCQGLFSGIKSRQVVSDLVKMLARITIKVSAFLVENHHNHHYLLPTIYTTMSKRKLPRRELPYISTLLDKHPYSRLPTNGIVLKRLMFEVEHLPGTSLSSAAITVRDELVKVWEYAGYGDILHKPGYIVKQITSLHEAYKKLVKIPVNRRETPSFKTKEADFSKTLDQLLNITVESLRTSTLITAEDREFLLHHWDKTISSTQDNITKLQVEKKLAR